MRDQFDGDRIVLDNALTFVLHGTYQRIRAFAYREFAAHGLEVTPEQWMVLVRLWQHEPISQADLGELTLRDRPTMTRILDGMEGRGWIARGRDPDDARVRLVRLSGEGRALRKKMVPIARAIVTRAEAGIDEADLVTTRETLRRIAANLD
jgi:MarR family transcriptional regulator, organic hydroperoxide resistance regulator